MSRQLKLIFPILLALGVSILFWQTRSFELVNLDDFIYVDRYGQVADGLSAKNLAWAFSKEAAKRTSCWFPLTNISFLLDFSLFDGDPGVLHLENAFLHGVTLLLVYALLLKLLSPLVVGQKRGMLLFCAFVGAAFWGLHPLRVEVVAWVASRKDLLSTPLFILGLLLNLRSLDAPEKKGLRYSVPIVFMLALLAKPTAVSFPLMVIVTEWLYAGRVRIRETMQLVPILIFGCIMAYWGQNIGGALGDLAEVTFVQRVGNAVASIGAYAWQTVYPSSMGVPYCFVWPVNPFDLRVGIGVLVAVVAIFGWTVAVSVPYFRRKGPILERIETFGAEIPYSTRLLQTSLLWVGITLFPMLGLIGFGYHSRADRFTYLPAIGLSLLLAYALYRWMHRITWQGLRAMLVFCTSLVLLALGATTYQQTSYWANDYLLFRHSAAVTDSNWQAYSLIGGYLLGTQGDAVEAIEAYRKSIAIRESAEIRAQLALVGFVNQDLAIVEEQLQFSRQKQSDKSFQALYVYSIGLKSILEDQLDIGEARLWDARKLGVDAELISFPLGKLAEKRHETEKVALFYSMAARSPLFRWLEPTYSMTQAEIDAAVQKLFGKNSPTNDLNVFP